MILGCGIDMVEISRIRRAMEKRAFLQRVYTQAEREYFASRGAAESAAGGFAAKEAVAKALGAGFYGMTLRDIEVLHDELGRPYALLHGGALKRMQELGAKKMHITITHEKQYAIALAILEG